MSTAPSEQALRAAWLAERRNGIGASEVAAVLGVHPFLSPYELWVRKTGMAPEGEEAEESEAMYWGNVLEEVISAEYCRRTGRRVADHGRYTIQRNPKFPHVFATLDREILPSGGKGRGVLECKTTGAWAASEWELGAPLTYQVQVQVQLAVTGFEEGALAVLIGGQRYQHTEFQRNEEFICRMAEAVADFWARVVAKEPPPVDGSASTARALRALHPRDSGETVELPAEALQWHQDLEAAKAAMKAAEAARRVAENQLQAAIGDATFGLLPDGSSYSWRTQEREAHQVAASSFRVLRHVKSRARK